LIAKACVKLCCLAIEMKKWFEKRNVLAENGVSFPNIHGVDLKHAIWIEEFIPYTLKDAYKLATSPERKKALENQFYQTYMRIIGAGFGPIIRLHDLRSRGNDVVMIDVGEDIGNRNATTPTLSEDCVRNMAAQEFSSIVHA